MNRRRRLFGDLLDEGTVPAVGLAVGLFAFGLAVHRAWAIGVGNQVVLALVPLAALAASAWWEARDGDPLTALGLGTAPFLGLASLPIYYALFGTPFVTQVCSVTAGEGVTPCMLTFGYPVSLLLTFGLLMGAGGYALGILWTDIEGTLRSES